MEAAPASPVAQVCECRRQAGRGSFWLYCGDEAQPSEGFTATWWTGTVKGPVTWCSVRDESGDEVARAKLAAVDPRSRIFRPVSGGGFLLYE